MSNGIKLTREQRDRIESTLKRIRSGLKQSRLALFEEPAHTFLPEVLNANKK